jgi:hypothetical protein
MSEVGCEKRVNLGMVNVGSWMWEKGKFRIPETI